MVCLDSNTSYRDYMYGLDKYLIFVDKRPMNFATTQGDLQNISKRIIDDESGLDKLILRNMRTNRGSQNSYFLNNNNNNIFNPSSINNNNNNNKPRFNENNLCNYVSRTNYALFAPQIHLPCSQPLTGRYVFVQAVGRSHRRKRLFDAVLCEIQVYEV